MTAAAPDAAAAKIVDVLLVDDNPLDLLLAQEALAASGARIKLGIAHSGLEAMTVLRGQIDRSSECRSCLVLLDLNMPVWDGETTLSHIRRDPEICLTPVVMLTTSSADRDVERSYGAGANGYVVKPMQYDALVSFFSKLDHFWSDFMLLPRAPPQRLPQWL